MSDCDCVKPIKHPTVDGYYWGWWKEPEPDEPPYVLCLYESGEPVDLDYPIQIIGSDDIILLNEFECFVGPLNIRPRPPFRKPPKDWEKK